MEEIGSPEGSLLLRCHCSGHRAKEYLQVHAHVHIYFFFICIVYIEDWELIPMSLIQVQHCQVHYIFSLSKL